MTAALRLVSQSDLPEPPYSPDIRARGWAFDLDLERIHQSETWVLCPPDQRPWLLMLWASAWLSSPVGTWPQNDAVIAARIGMDARQFAANRDILMRGWYLACDGLYYHPVISERVRDMIDARTKDRTRQAAWRAKNKAGDAPNSDESQSVTRDTYVSHGTAPLPAPQTEKTKTLAPSCIRNSAPPAADASPVVIELPTVGPVGTTPIHESLVLKIKQAYPGLDVQAELRKAKLWLEADPKRRKTARGLHRFVLGWMGRAQNRGPTLALAAMPAQQPRPSCGICGSQGSSVRTQWGARCLTHRYTE